jgi:hypothetical protein
MAEPRCAISALKEWSSLPTNKLQRRRDAHRAIRQTIPRTSEQRLQRSLQDPPLDTIAFCHDVTRNSVKEDKTVLYLAYGSNLCDETFLGKRHIKPVSQINVVVPEISMTFDLPGIAYKEPCFANVRRREVQKEGEPEYRKDRWHKGLVGVVYEVTPEDYAHIIATEGGGAGYQDVLVDCHPLEINPRHVVPEVPHNASFKAHTLFEPAKKGRNDPSYAQPSARYLKLITDGAMERGLPYEYQDFLHQIRPYRITTTKQQAGQILYLLVWGPLFALFMQVLGPLFAKPDGTFPAWMATLLRTLFTASWGSYDHFFKPTFGDGERTIGDSRENCIDSLDEKAPLIKDTISRYGIHGRLDIV